MKEKEQENKLTHVIFESRGKAEDAQLELEFRKITSGNNYMHTDFNFEIKFASKHMNSSGLQIADLVARPIGIKTIRPEQENRAFSILEEKFYCKNGRKNTGHDYNGYGLKIFP